MVSRSVLVTLGLFSLPLLMLGCAVSFIAAAGAYVYIRERFTGQEEERVRPAPVRAEEHRPGRAA